MSIQENRPNQDKKNHTNRRDFLAQISLGTLISASGMGASGLMLAPLSAKAQAALPPVPADAPYKNLALPIAERVADLLSRMSLEEKIQQITTVWRQKPDIYDANTQFDPVRFAAHYPDGMGHLARPNDRSGLGSPVQVPFRGPAETVTLTNAIQQYHQDHTRLKIPVLFHEEGLHGYAARGATSFPQAIALASSWDPELIHDVFSVVGREIRARGVSLVLAPVVDVARDPRWGRIEETYGEDAHLVGEMGVAAIKGFQGDTLPLAPGKVLATLKHMTGHGQPESGTNTGPAEISERTLRENFFPPFEQAVKRTNIRAVMASYNEIDGVPSHANPWLLNGVLRGEWHFKGAVVSDYQAIEELADIHHIEPDWSGAAIRAIRSGVDADLPNGDSFGTLAQSVRDGRISEAELDASVARMLEIKFQAGLFENPYADGAYAEAITDNDEARALAQKAAEKSIVLLKNDGLLPLNPAQFRGPRPKKLALIGPNAAVARLGGYINVPRHTVSILQGVQAYLGANTQVLTHEGVRLTVEDPAGDWWRNPVVQADPAENRHLIAQAVAVARRADTIVLCIGGTSGESREGWRANHLGDRDSINLLGEQQELYDALARLGKPMVVVLINGRPQSIVEIAGNARAIIEGWYLGQEGGHAMARVLFGDVNPGGKLPVTIARNVGQLPLFYNRKPSSRRGYLFADASPLYPFGFGLSYTQFDIGAPTLSASTIKAGENVTVSVDIRNIGNRSGDEVVQLYVRDDVSSITRPLLELKGFKRITLAAGEIGGVEFTLTPEAFWMYNEAMERVIEPGTFTILVGPNSASLKEAKLTITR